MSSQSRDRTSWPYSQLTAASALTEKKRPDAFTRERTSSSSSEEQLQKVPRTPRFAEATTVYSPIEASEEGKSPFADPPTTAKSQTFMAQSQPSDIGFGYINDSSRDPVEVPQTPASPLKSAMKVPGTPGRKIDNPMSPTFREEQMLEKHEVMTEKEQARDLVRSGFPCKLPSRTNTSTENQDSSSVCQVLPSWSQLQLQSYRSLHAFDDLLDFQRNPRSADEEWPSSMGCRDKNLATEGRACHILCFACPMSCCILELLERWP